MKHTNNGQQYWLQEVGSNAFNIKITKNRVYSSLQAQYIPGEFLGHGIILPTGTWQIHSDSLTMTEEQAGEIVEKVMLGKWKNYGYPLYYEMLKDSSIDSFHSLLRSLGLDGKRIIVLKKM